MAQELSALHSLPPARLVKAIELMDYMLGEGRQNTDANDTLVGLSNRLNDAGLPMDRVLSVVRLLHAEDAASARLWERGTGARSFTFPFVRGGSNGYETSPAAEAHRTGEWVTLWLPETPDEAYGVVRELKDGGYTHHVTIPVFMANGMSNTFAFATKSPDGFSPDDFTFLRAIFPAIAACQEILATHRILDEVTRMYLGEEPHRRILEGDVHRGEVVHIRSAILFADMRRFTELTAEMSAEDATNLLNAYYDCVVPAIESRGGEVLKFIGDGILAMFRTRGDSRSACQSALTGASAALEEVARCEGPVRFEVGIALHFGEVAYGNVGSGIRLDYTVIGRDVNFAARIAGLCGGLDRPLLVSESFRERAGQNGFVSVGRHALKGLAEPQEIFAM